MSQIIRPPIEPGITFSANTFSIDNNFLPGLPLDKPNVFERTYLKLARGGALTRTAPAWQRGLGNNLAEIGADYSLGRVDIPYRLDRDPEANFWDQLDPNGEDLYLQIGLTPAMFKDKTQEESVRLYEQTVRLYALDEHIARSDAFFDIAVSNTLAVGAGILTDPVTLVTAGTGGIVSQAGKLAGKAALTQAGKRIATGSVISRMKALENNALARRLVVGAVGSSSAAGFNLAYQSAAYQSQVNTGLIEDLGFDVNEGELLFSATLGGLLGAVFASGFSAKKTRTSNIEAVKMAAEETATPGSRTILYNLNKGVELDIAVTDGGSVDKIDSLIRQMFGVQLNPEEFPWKYNTEGGLAEWLDLRNELVQEQWLQSNNVTSSVSSNVSGGTKISVTGFRGSVQGAATLDDARFYSGDRAVAKGYAGPKGTVEEVNITFNNALVVDNWIAAKKMLQLNPATTMQELLNEIKKRGYDGAVFKKHTNGPEYVAFASNQNPKLSLPLNIIPTAPMTVHDVHAFLLKAPTKEEFLQFLGIPSFRNMEALTPIIKKKENSLKNINSELDGIKTELALRKKRRKGTVNRKETTAELRAREKALLREQDILTTSIASSKKVYNDMLRFVAFGDNRPETTKFQDVIRNIQEADTKIQALLKKRRNTKDTDLDAINAIDDELKVARNNLDVLRAERKALADQFRLGGANAVLRQVDAALENIPETTVRTTSVNNQQKQLTEITEPLIMAIAEGSDVVVTGYLEKLRRLLKFKSIGDFFSAQGLLNKGQNKVLDHRTRALVYIMAALDDTNVHHADWRGRGYFPRFSAAKGRSQRIANKILSVHQKVWKDKTLTQAKKTEIINHGHILYANPSDLRGVDIHPLSKEIAESLKIGYKEWTDAGTRSGYLNNIIDGFAPTGGMLNRGMKSFPVITNLLWKAYQKRFIENDEISAQVALHLGLLTRSTDGKLAVAAKYADQGITKLKKSDLDPDDLKLYLDQLLSEDGVLYKVAQSNIARKNATDPEMDWKPREDWDKPIEDARYSNELEIRKIDQEVFYNRAGIDSGEIVIDPVKMLHRYAAGPGYHIFRQETVNGIVGRKGISYQALLRWMEQELVNKSDPNNKVFVENLFNDFKKLERMQAGKELPKSVSPNLNIFANLISTAVSGGTSPLYALGVEMRQNLVFNYIRDAGAKNFLSLLFSNKGLWKALLDNKETVAGFHRGIEYIKRSPRFMEDPNLAELSVQRASSRANTSLIANLVDAFKGRTIPRSGAAAGINTRIEAVTEAVADATHVIGLGDYLDRANRTIVNFMSVGMVERYFKKLDKFAEALADANPRNIKDLKGAARKAGIKPQHAEVFLKTGMVDPDTRAGLKALYDMDPTLFDHPDKMFEKIQNIIIRENNVDTKEQMEIAFLRLRDFMESEMNTLVPRTSILQRSATDRPEGIFINQFTSFARAANAKMFPRMLGGSVAGSLLAYISYVSGEMIMADIIQVLQGKAAPEEILEKYDEENLASTVSTGVGRTPVAGPFSSIGTSMVDDLIQGHKARARAPSVPALNTLGDVITSTADLARAPFDDRLDFDEKDREKALRLVPGWNLWYRQVFGELLEGED